MKVDEQCVRRLSQEIFMPVGEIGKTALDLYKHFDEKLFQPLGYKVKRETDLSSVLTNIHDLHSKSSIFKNQPNDINY